MKVVLLIAALLSSVSTVQADISSYEDSNGIVHFTEVETDRSFKTFTGDIVKSPEELKQQMNKAYQRRVIYCEQRCSMIEESGVTVDIRKCNNNCMKSKEER